MRSVMSQADVVDDMALAHISHSTSFKKLRAKGKCYNRQSVMCDAVGPDCKSRIASFKGSPQEVSDKVA